MPASPLSASLFQLLLERARNSADLITTELSSGLPKLDQLHVRHFAQALTKLLHAEPIPSCQERWSSHTVPLLGFYPLIPIGTMVYAR